MSSLILKRASASRSSGQWRDDDYDVLEGGTVVGRPAAPEGRRWMWTLARADARGGDGAFAKRWRRQ
jgi:hypothetical protein